MNSRGSRFKLHAKVLEQEHLALIGEVEGRGVREFSDVAPKHTINN